MEARKAATPESKERRRRLYQAIAQKSYEFNCHGVEMGQLYTSSAVVPDGTAAPVPTRDPELYYHPSTFPGAYLPHAWVQRGQERLSTLDLVGHGRFTLLTGVGGKAWRGVAAQVAATLGIAIDVVSIGGPRCDVQDVHGRWADLAGISQGQGHGR